SLTSWRRASNAASAPATTARKRRSAGSLRVSERFGDLAGLQAAGAHVHPPRGGADHDPNLLEVRVETALGRDHRMAAALAEGGALPGGAGGRGHAGVQSRLLAVR